MKRREKAYITIVLVWAICIQVLDVWSAYATREASRRIEHSTRELHQEVHKLNYAVDRLVTDFVPHDDPLPDGGADARTPITGGTPYW